MTMMGGPQVAAWAVPGMVAGAPFPSDGVPAAAIGLECFRLARFLAVP
jgi:hypothetical protein